jgi:hypothetical protein
VLAVDDADALAAVYPAPPDVLPDGDGDGVEDPRDRCPAIADPEQADADGDGVGDRCDPCPTTGGAAAACGRLVLERLVVRYGSGRVLLRARVPRRALAANVRRLSWNARSGAGPTVRVGPVPLAGWTLRGAAYLRADGWHLRLRGTVGLLPAPALPVTLGLDGGEFGTLASCAAIGRRRLECREPDGTSPRA